jgi:hypothetical protein
VSRVVVAVAGDKDEDDDVRVVLAASNDLDHLLQDATAV